MLLEGLLRTDRNQVDQIQNMIGFLSGDALQPSNNKNCVNAMFLIGLVHGFNKYLPLPFHILPFLEFQLRLVLQLLAR